jgi:hypothetical protein
VAEDGAVLAVHEADAGILAVPDGAFAEALRQALGALQAPAGLPVVLSGMITSRQGWHELPYLDCPDSRHARLESVVTLRAEKMQETAPLPKYQSLPDWLARGREPIPLLPAFQTQAMTTRIYAFIMTLIDGKRSLQDIAAIMEEQQLMPKADAETAIRGFLIRMFEEALQQQA